MTRRPPRSTLFPYRRSSDLIVNSSHTLISYAVFCLRDESVTGVHDRREQLRELIPAFDSQVTTFASRQGDVSASLRGLDALLRVSGPALGEVNAAFPVLRATTAEVRPALREAPETLRLALPLPRQLAGLAAPREGAAA